uniref:Peroxin-19 n=1 Tax=Ditylenchus dipsaci TaxID=166011 RepID=A0A915EAN6_9BILA
MSSEDAKDADKQEDEDNLSSLLDSALGDFGKNKKSDDDLDDFMASMDREAAQKAAKKFQQMLEEMAQAGQNDAEEGDSTHISAGPSSSEQNSFMEAINRLSQQTGNLANAGDDKSFMEALNNLDEKDPAVDDFMGMIVETALSKEVMYPAIKEITDKFEIYLAEQNGKLDSQLYAQYVEQQKILLALCGEYEKTEDQQNVEPDEQRASKIAKLWMELQQHGVPPAEVAGAMPNGWMNDGEMGNAMNTDAFKEGCALIFFGLAGSRFSSLRMLRIFLAKSERRTRGLASSDTPAMQSATIERGASLLKTASL